MTSNAINIQSSAVAQSTRATLAGAFATMLSFGFARISSTTLLPNGVQDRLMEAAHAANLGTANLVGYLAGALLAHPLVSRVRPAVLMRSLMLLTATALLACAWQINAAWLFTSSLIAGVGSGALMVLVAAAVLPHICAAYRRAASGLIFTGGGLGLAVSGLAGPMLMKLGPRQAWVALGVIALVLTVAAWNWWPDKRPAAKLVVPLDQNRATDVQALSVQYVLVALGLVPHMVLLADFAAQGMHQGLLLSIGFWLVFGLASIAGPVLMGRLSDRQGAAQALRIVLILEAVAALLPAIGVVERGSVWMSVAVVGAFTPGVIPLARGRLKELLPARAAERRASWSRATVGFAIAMTGGTYAMSLLRMTASDGVAMLFRLGLVAPVLALGIDFAARVRVAHPCVRARIILDK